MGAIDIVDVNNLTGLRSNQMTDGFNKYVEGTGLKLVFNNLDHYGSDIPSFSKDIKDSISKGIPVIFFLITDKNERGEYEEITLYKYNSESYIKITKNDPDSTYNHGMTITGVVYDDIAEEFYYILSSWGQRYVISASEFLEKCKKESSTRDAGFFFLQSDD